MNHRYCLLFIVYCLLCNPLDMVHWIRYNRVLPPQFILEFGSDRGLIGEWGLELSGDLLDWLLYLKVDGVSTTTWQSYGGVDSQELLYPFT